MKWQGKYYFDRCLPRGGWPRAELHHGLILQNASVYTISRAVRTSGQATEDPLNLEFLSSFRCKCWRLNVILLHNSSDCLTITWWSMKTMKREVFCDRVPEWWVHARSISPTPADVYFRSCHFSNVYRYVNNCASRAMQIYAAQPAAQPAQPAAQPRNESLLKCNFFWPRLFTFLLMARKLYFSLIFLYGTEEIQFVSSEFIGLCVLSQHMSYMLLSLRSQCSILLYYRKMCLCALSLLVIELKLSCNLEYSCTLLKYP